MYQLAAELENGVPILNHIIMMAAETVRGDRAPVSGNGGMKYSDVHTGVFWFRFIILF